MGGKGGQFSDGKVGSFQAEKTLASFALPTDGQRMVRGVINGSFSIARGR
jgi:hypothetical protein